MNDKLQDAINELHECKAALEALLERDPDLMSRVCGSTTLGNRLIHVRATLHQCALSAVRGLDVARVPPSFNDSKEPK